MTCPTRSRAGGNKYVAHFPPAVYFIDQEMHGGSPETGGARRKRRGGHGIDGGNRRSRRRAGPGASGRRTAFRLASPAREQPEAVGEQCSRRLFHGRSPWISSEFRADGETESRLSCTQEFGVRLPVGPRSGPSRAGIRRRSRSGKAAGFQPAGRGSTPRCGSALIGHGLRSARREWRPPGGRRPVIAPVRLPPRRAGAEVGEVSTAARDHATVEERVRLPPLTPYRAGAAPASRPGPAPAQAPHSGDGGSGFDPGGDASSSAAPRGFGPAVTARRRGRPSPG